MFIYKQTEFFSKDGADLWTVGHMEGQKFIPESDHGSKEDAVERVKELNGGGSGHLVRPDGRINRAKPVVQHTPGPWEFSREDVENKPNYHFIIEDTKGERVIATVHGNDGEANARLIAAAPELLEALKALTEHLTDKGGYSTHGSSFGVAKQAIAKAEGRDVA